ncbi:MAG: hypothetical protein DMG24_11265 [Acidobacteria bacterium]|nr:MAG: hypothetical protein DMG24_11265 [Acidobacteriota bacterium]
MRRVLCSVGVGLIVWGAATLVFSKEEKAKAGPLTGTWECKSRGGSKGDTPFTLVLQQDGEKVSGSVSSAEGGMEITSATFKEGVLEIRLETPEGNYVLTGKLKDGELSGDTTKDGNHEANWEGKKAAAPEDKSSR